MKLQSNNSYINEVKKKRIPRRSVVSFLAATDVALVVGMANSRQQRKKKKKKNVEHQTIILFLKKKKTYANISK